MHPVIDALHAGSAQFPPVITAVKLTVALRRKRHLPGAEPMRMSDGCEVPLGDAEVIEGLYGPTGLLTVVERILNYKVFSQVLVSR